MTAPAWNGRDGDGSSRFALVGECFILLGILVLVVLA